MKQVFLSSLMVVGLAASLAAQAPAPAAVDLKVGDKAPDFALPGTDGKTHKLGDYKGKMVVIAWYPAAFTGGCTAECRSIRDSSDTLKKFDVAYFMASVDTAEKNKQFADQEQVNFPLLSDPEKKVAMAYGVVPPTGAGVAKRWTFYIDGKGTIVSIDKAVDPMNKKAGEELAKTLTSLGAKSK